MKKIINYFCFFFIISCAGYEPIFSTKNTKFYIAEVRLSDNNKISRKIEKKLQSYKVVDYNKTPYFLMIKSVINNQIVSKDSSGDPLIYLMTVRAEVKVITKETRHYFNADFFIDNIILEESFNYNNQKNKFDLNQYKKSIEENLANKIQEKLIIRLLTLE